MTDTKVINFGVSDYSRYAPGVPWEERKMNILIDEQLEDLTFRHLKPGKADPRKSMVKNFSDVRGNKYDELPAVFFRLIGERSNEWTIKLIWLKERQKWIAIQHLAWEECACRIDESEWGPFKLSDYCKKMLAMAYGVDMKKLSKDITTISPRELEN